MVHSMVAQLKNLKTDIIVGGNIGKNKITPNENAVDDYIYSFKELYPWVDYFTINVSSPNTPGLRALQEKEPLMLLLKQLLILRNELIAGGQKIKPVFLKIAPDLTETQLDEIIEIAFELKLDGIVASNTTITRDNLTSSPDLISEAGGLSGRPVEQISNKVISYIHKQSNGKLPIIGVGGVSEPDDFKRKLDAGASLVQLYTGFIYKGPSIVKDLYRKA
ncbi:MAG: quinone-dependent dihydroorotate dehydrogenase [Bacteroidetes bacterium]|nr:quinone-dependent dihydroorotate dehydrogenase [Bacteroidota bacterium]